MFCLEGYVHGPVLVLLKKRVVIVSHVAHARGSEKMRATHRAHLRVLTSARWRIDMLLPPGAAALASGALSASGADSSSWGSAFHLTARVVLAVISRCALHLPEYTAT